MKVVCNREQLSHAFHLVSAVAPTKSPKPVLQNVRLEVTQEKATLMATDLEVGIRLDVPGFEISAPGVVLLPISRFGSILRETDDEKLQIENDGRSITVVGLRSEFRLPTENPDEYPAIPQAEEDKYHEMPARFFRELVRRTVFATDPESSRYALGGVLLELTEDRVTAVGTDGRRLARQEGPATSVGGHTTSGSNTIIPSRSMNLLDRLLADDEGNVQLTARGNDVVVRTSKATLTTRLVEGRYPRWRDVFPSQDDAFRIDVVAGPFHSTVRQAAIVVSEERRGVEFAFGEGKLALSCHGAQAGESHVELPIGYDGAVRSVVLDPRYVSEFLKVLNPEQAVHIDLKTPDSPVVYSTDDGYSYVVMPLARER